MAIAGYSTSDAQFVDGYGGAGTSTRNYPGDYALELEEAERWRSSDEAAGGFGLAGLQVTLDAADESAALYPVVSNEGHALIVESETDLSEHVGRQLLGVHVLDGLSVGGGASLSFGGDRLHVDGAAALHVQSGSTRFAPASSPARPRPP